MKILLKKEHATLIDLDLSEYISYRLLRDNNAYCSFSFDYPIEEIDFGYESLLYITNFYLPHIPNIMLEPFYATTLRYSTNPYGNESIIINTLVKYQDIDI